MKKFLSIVLSVCLLFALVVIPTNAGYVYEHDKSNNFSFEINFEEGSHTMYYAYWQGLITWKVNREYTYSYYPGGYGSPSIADNPLRGTGSDANGVSNTSVYTLNMKRAANQGWGESGGQVMNVSTANGYAPIILQDGVTYRLSFDYLVESTYVTEAFKDQDGNMYTNTGEDNVTIGYGYNTEGTRAGKHVKQIDKIFSYDKSKNTAEGTYTGDHGTTRNVGNWYHVEYTFTPNFAQDGLTEFDYNATGDVVAETGAPFLMLYHTFRNGTSVHFDNIQVAQEVKVNVNPMYATVGTGYTSGFCGEEIKLGNSVIRDGFVIEDWYYDGAYTRPVEDNKFTADLHGKTIYPKWRKSSGNKFSYTQDFENYSLPSGLSNGDKFKTATFSETNVMQYSYSKNYLESFLGNEDRIGDENRFWVATIDNLTAGKNYRISFKYYLSSGNGVTVYPVLTDSSSNIQKYDSSSLSLSVNSSWVKETITVNVTDAKNYLYLHVHANENLATVVYIDDVKVEEYAVLTVNAGEGTINGKATDTIEIEYDTALDSLNLKNGDNIVEGFYKDSAFTQKVTTFDGTFSEVYVKWTDVDTLEKYEYTYTLKNAEHTREFAGSGRYAIKANAQTGTAVAGIKKAERRATYIVNFKYFAPAGTSAKISAGTVEFDENHTTTAYNDFAVEVAGSGDWKEATVAYTENAAKTSNIVTALFVEQIGSGSSTVYIDDIKVIKVADTNGFVIYDTMSHNGNATYVCAAKQTALSNPTTVLDGYTLNGWYTDKGLTNSFADTVITGKTKVYAKVTAKSTSVAGDVNADGVLDVRDYAPVKEFILGLSNSLPNSADMNNDGVINAMDLVLMRNQINA